MSKLTRASAVPEQGGNAPTNHRRERGRAPSWSYGGRDTQRLSIGLYGDHVSSFRPQGCKTNEQLRYTSANSSRALLVSHRDGSTCREALVSQQSRGRLEDKADTLAGSLAPCSLSHSSASARRPSSSSRAITRPSRGSCWSCCYRLTSCSLCSTTTTTSASSRTRATSLKAGQVAAVHPRRPQLTSYASRDLTNEMKRLVWKSRSSLEGHDTAGRVEVSLGRVLEAPLAHLYPFDSLQATASSSL